MDGWIEASTHCVAPRRVGFLPLRVQRESLRSDGALISSIAACLQCMQQMQPAFLSLAMLQMQVAVPRVFLLPNCTVELHRRKKRLRPKPSPCVDLKRGRTTPHPNPRMRPFWSKSGPKF
jgi:hypothetical protein